MPNETLNHIVDAFPIDRDALQNEDEPGRVEIIKEFSLNTSTHGIPGIARSRSIPNRLYWSISLIAFAGIMVYFITTAILAYFEYPTQTSVTTIVEWPQAFPAVTICNYSPIRYDRFIHDFLNYTNSLNLTNKTSTDDFTEEQSIYVYNFLIDKMNRNESITEYLYSLDSMLIYGDFNGLSCTATNFTWFLSATHGLCYTFNAKLKNTVNDGIVHASTNGGLGIFKIQLYAHQHQYVPYLTFGSGIVAMIHDNARVPSVEQEGLLLGPGQHHRISYVKKRSTFLPEPYTTCSGEASARMQLMLDQYNGTDYGYSQVDCYYACLHAYIYEQCGCGNPFRWNIPFSLLFNGDQPVRVPLCLTSNPCYGPAMGQLVDNVSVSGVYCPDCRQECLAINFNIKLSSVVAPPDFYLTTIKAFVESSGVNLTNTWSSTWINDIKSSYVSFEVIYETSRTDVFSQQATTSPVDVISDVGGQTGLWIGISFLSLFEVVEMLYRLIRYECFLARRFIQRRLRHTDTNTTPM